MLTIKNQGIISELKSQIDKYDIISFDIFDTLLLRTYVMPTDLFIHLEKLNDEEDFAKKRMYADTAARIANPQCEEITLDHIYHFLGNRYKYLKQQELDLEESVLIQNPEIFEAYQYAIEQGKKVIIASDMYLPKDFLEIVLEKNGYNGYYKFYLSSELNKTKRSSSLYKYVIEDLGVNPSQILHVGDNEQSDCQVANALGINPFYYEKIIIRFLRQNNKALIYYKNNQTELGVSIILGLLAIKSLKAEDNYWNTLGYDYAGPLTYAYDAWLHKKVKEENIKDILFVARDGYTLKKCFDLIKEDDIKTHYFYAPRLLYLAIKLDPNSKIAANEIEKLSATKFILDYYKNKHPLLKENTPEIKHSEDGIVFIQSNIQLYQELALEEIKSYLSYIDSENIESENIALVDVISLSLSSQKLLKTFLVDQSIQGYYFWFLRQTSYEHPDYYCNSFVKDPDTKACLNLLELLLMAPESPVQGIVDDKPLYKEHISDSEKERIEIYPYISDAAIDFVKDVKKHYKGKDVFITDKNIYEWLSLLGQVPNQDDIDNLKDIKTGIDSNHTLYVPIFQNFQPSAQS